MIYAQGESAPSNTVTLTTTAIKPLTVDNLDGADVQVFTVDGKLVAEGKHVLHALQAGRQYVVKNKKDGTVVHIMK